MPQKKQEQLEQIMGQIEEVVSSAEQDGFTDPKDNMYHGHKVGKHCITDLVSEEVIDEMEHNPNSHEAVWEVYYKHNNGEIEVSQSAMENIESLVEDGRAPISEEARTKMEDKWGGGP